MQVRNLGCRRASGFIGTSAVCHVPLPDEFLHHRPKTADSRPINKLVVVADAADPPVRDWTGADADAGGPKPGRSQRCHTPEKSGGWMRWPLHRSARPRGSPSAPAQAPFLLPIYRRHSAATRSSGRPAGRACAADRRRPPRPILGRCPLLSLRGSLVRFLGGREASPSCVPAFGSPEPAPMLTGGC